MLVNKGEVFGEHCLGVFVGKCGDYVFLILSPWFLFNIEMQILLQIKYFGLLTLVFIQHRSPD